ncbi:MAG: ribosomal-protein-alanine N-acetyltransferase [Ruminococcaceae bacterium]|nr:ribosomal-protein-alanine N-acetyltransferase [Oscillospiraceae bacterium]
MNYKISPLSYENIDGVFSVELTSFENPWSKQAFIDEINNPLARYFVLENENEVIGYAGLWHIIDEGHITNIAVKPAFRGQGLSKLLMNELVDYYKSNSLVFLTLEVRESNLVARRLYESYGFKIIGERKKYYQNNETAVLYSLEG